ncbi:hypothetical protein [Sphingomonas sp.]|uniref:hypothetical protein n=1 Tax=Sphingomonas sp. TaxID=28214 RepID=UPI002EDA4D3F
MGIGPVAHAAEDRVCVEAGSLDHGAERDQGSSESDGADKNFSHQHTGCHAHHFAALADEADVPSLLAASAMRSAIRIAALVPAPGDPALRPPQA